MALSIDGSAAVYASTSNPSVTGTLACANAGNVIVVAITNNGASGSTVSSITGGGVTFSLRASQYSGDNGIELWTGYASGTFNAAVTVNFSGAGTLFATVHAFAISGAPSSSYFDVNASLPNKGSTDPRTVSTSAADTIIIGVARMSDANPTAGSGYTRILGGTGSGFQLTEYKIVSSTQSGLSVTVGNPGASNGMIADAIVAIASGGQTVSVPAAAVTVAALAPAVKQPHVVLPPAAAITVAARTPTVVQPHKVVVPAAAVVVAAPLPAIFQGQRVLVPAAAVAVAALAPVVNRTQSVKVPAASITVAALAPTVVQSGGLPTPVTGGGGGAQGGGKRSANELVDELPLFKKLEKKRKHQSIEDILRDLDEPKIVPTTAAKEAKATEATVIPLPKKEPIATEPDSQLDRIEKQLNDLQKGVESLKARAEKAEEPPDTDEDDAEILSILMGLL